VLRDVQPSRDLTMEGGLFGVTEDGQDFGQIEVKVAAVHQLVRNLSL
jgi:hypothetical protein